MPASTQLVWERLPFLQPFIYTEYMESQTSIHCVINMCRVGCILYKHCHHFYDNQTGVQDSSTVRFIWWLKLWNNTFWGAALLEGSVMQHVCLWMLSCPTRCSWLPGQRHAGVNLSRWYQSSVTVQHWGCPSQIKDQKSQQWLLAHAVRPSTHTGGY